MNDIFNIEEITKALRPAIDQLRREQAEREPEPLTFHGVPVVFDDPSSPECGLCHQNRPLPYIVEDGLFALEGKPLVAPICQQCRDLLMN